MNTQDHNLGSLPRELFSISQKIAIHFDVQELKTLCLELGISYDNLAGETKIGKVEELTLWFHRRIQTQLLLDTLQRHRPNVDFLETLNLSTVTQALPPERKIELNYIVRQLDERYQALLEWKELHNHLDTILNISFGQYYTQLQRVNRRRTDALSVSTSWSPVALSMARLLTWAQEIRFIGVRYENVNGVRRGELWAVVLSANYESIDQHLRGGQSTDKKEVWWWNQLLEYSARFDHEIKVYMSQADQRLRSTAAELYDLSRLLLRR